MSVAGATVQDTHHLADPTRPKRRGELPSAIAGLLADIRRAVFETYHPERHYMRGPGPACAERQAPRR